MVRRTCVSVDAPSKLMPVGVVLGRTDPRVLRTMQSSTTIPAALVAMPVWKLPRMVQLEITLPVELTCWTRKWILKKGHLAR